MCNWNDGHLLGFYTKGFVKVLGSRNAVKFWNKDAGHKKLFLALPWSNTSLNGWSIEPIKRSKTALTRNQSTAYKRLFRATLFPVACRDTAVKTWRLPSFTGILPGGNAF